MENNRLTYREAGVDIARAEAAKRDMAEALACEDRRVIAKPGAFAALFQADFHGIANPMLVLKAEEPGSKQALAFQYGRVESICRDLVHHLVNDIVVMGAKPEAVLDTILCGKLERDVAVDIVRSMAEACRAQDCSLVGGETSEQPGVLAEGQYMLNASIVGVVDRDRVIDGSKIREGDAVLAVASNGVHTNGYSLIRRLIEQSPELVREPVEDESFLEAILRPHKCYYHPLKDLIRDTDHLHGLAHITGGGIAGNLNRILPAGTDARIDRERIEVLPVFRVIQAAGQVSDEEMLRTYNMGVGLAIVTDKAKIPLIQAHLGRFGCHSYEIGDIVGGGSQEVRFK